MEENIAAVPNKEIYKYLKRFIDIVLSLLGIIILFPLFIIIAIFIKLETKGPILFVHTRVGKNGKYFKLLKFRTMVSNAQELINEFSKEQKKEFYENFKLQEDPRITKVGKILRKTALDELPQLINILKGELSIIGPRPIIDIELEKYKENKRKFLSVTPGLTGYWVANRKKDTPYEERIKMELYYVDNFSFKLDFNIFFKTIASVIRGNVA